MFKLCLFDLDDTLVKTEDLEKIRAAGKDNDTKEYRAKVGRAYLLRDREVYTEEILGEIRKEFPDLKLGVFTRSPRAYAESILQHAYPLFKWDVVITYDDVKRTKPYGEGIIKAMDTFGIERLDHVLMVGDQESDIRAAYNAGIAVVLDTTTWGDRTYDNWNSIGRIPDAIIQSPDRLIQVIRSIPKFQPDLERLLAGESESVIPRRFDRVGKFIPKLVVKDTTSYPVFCCGRSFAGYKSISEREKWHALSKSIQVNKESKVFPAEWVESVYGFVRQKYPDLSFGGNLVISVIPHRPGRVPRLENLLKQLEGHFEEKAFVGLKRITFEPELLAYKDGVQSNHKEHLSAEERFLNVRNHLYVKKPGVVNDGKQVLVIDDVCTTGASLIYAGKFLQAAGSGAVTRLAISMNIGNVLYEK
ncbi:MAG: HAD-IA family hydrolase [Rhodobacteraceae bacterium]|nr:HAD-IA family hydrolase [Paracoccaceae bacterium]MCZ8084993.1 HAD-IA family hydrolase [Paracoccaceae bacterium]